MNEDIFEKQSVVKSVFSLAVPTMVGMLVLVLYNMVDTFFIGKLNDPNKVAAVSLTTPVFVLLMSLGSVFGIGGGSYISRLLGMKEIKKVKVTASFSFYACIVMGILATIGGLIFMPQILNIVGASINTYDFTKGYLNIIFMGAVPIILSFSLGQIIRAEGAAKESMAGMMIGTILNIILNPIFIFTFKMGVVGSAIATILANIISTTYYLYYIVTKSKGISISLKDCKINKDIIKNILLIGIPASLTDVLMSIANIVLNNYAANYGDNVVAALGIVSRVIMMPAMLCIGLGQGAQPLIGYNWGAKNINRMKSAIKVAVISGTGICLVLTAIFYLADNFIISIFIKDPTVILLGAKFLKITIMSLPLLGIQIIMISSFQAMGKAMPSLILSICRQGIIFIPSVIVLNAAIGLTGIVIAQPVADFITVMLTAVLYFKVAKEFPVELESNIYCVDSMK